MNNLNVDQSLADACTREALSEESCFEARRKRRRPAAAAKPEDSDDSCPNDPEDSAVRLQKIARPDITVIAPELRILRQPESQHRARYMSEGSRGAIKGRHGKSFSTIQLSGYSRPTTVEVFAGNERGAPHLLYRLIPVTGKGGPGSTTPCKELTKEDGSSVISFALLPDNKMTAVLDCVGILKICGHEMRARVPKSAKATSVRLVFRLRVPGGPVLQTISDPITCVQQMGHPEVQRASLDSDSVRGGAELFLLGRNFAKDTRVLFREWGSDGTLVWSAEAPLLRAHLHACHLVCEVPAYSDHAAQEPVELKPSELGLTAEAVWPWDASDVAAAGTATSEHATYALPALSPADVISACSSHSGSVMEIMETLPGYRPSESSRDSFSVSPDIHDLVPSF